MQWTQDNLYCYLEISQQYTQTKIVITMQLGTKVSSEFKLSQLEFEFNTPISIPHSLKRKANPALIFLKKLVCFLKI